MNLLSFHNDKKIKTKYVNRLKSHAKADELVQGFGWENGKGCAVGCTLENYSHEAYEKELGIPEWMARLYDSIFEGLPNEDAKKFAVEFLKSVPVGVDLNPIKWSFSAFILKENIDRVLALTIDEKLKEQVISSIRGVLSLHEKALLTGCWDESAARSAERSAAWSAARSAERSAAWSAESAAWSAESAAWSAARSAESAAWSAAWSAARSAERSAERSAAFQRYAQELIRLVKAAK